MGKIIEVKGLTKKYNNFLAVDHISFSVNEGELFAFLGSNGAGKSTTIDILCTLKKFTEGTMTVAGKIVGKQDDQIRKSIGVVFQKSLLDPLLTVYENLKVRASFYGIYGKRAKERIEEVSGIIGMDEFMNRPYGKLSGGQKRRADIARAIINAPSILFLDEPTTGLDPQTRIFVWNTIANLQKEKHMTVFLTTHYMEEAASADNITIIKKGHIMVQGTPQQLKDLYARDVVKIVPKDEDNLKECLSVNNLSYDLIGGAYVVKIESTIHALDILNMHKSNIESFEVQKGNMDDVFLNVIGENLNSEEDK